MGIDTGFATLYVGRCCGGGWFLLRYFGRSEVERWRLAL